MTAFCNLFMERPRSYLHNVNTKLFQTITSPANLVEWWRWKSGLKSKSKCSTMSATHLC